MNKPIFLLPLLLLVVVEVSCQNRDSEYDQMMNEVFASDGPGGVALIARDGEILFRKAYGMANLELDVEMSPDQVFRIGSITKQFTACAILKLAEEGKLDLQDDITNFIEDYPTHGYTITIEHLLTHTSGIKSYTSMMEWTEEVRKRDFTPAELVDFFKNEPMDFAPGEEFRYNNSAYFLLGYIVEIVSGKSYETFIDENFFQPLGMKNSYYGSTTRIIHNRSDGYAMGKDGYINADFLSMTQPFGAGSLLSTVDDLYTWYTAVMNHEVISEESLTKATTTSQLNNGKKTGYGYGWFIRNIQGSPNITHGGGINGFLTASLFIPEERLFVAVFSNCTCIDPGNLAVNMAAITLGKPYEWDSISLDVRLLKSYEAVYTSEFDGDLVITYRDGVLYAMVTGVGERKIVPFKKDEFFSEEEIETLHFVRGSENEIISAMLKSNTYDIEWKRTDNPIPVVEAIDVDESVLKEYIGKYQLGPESILSIILEDGKIYVDPPDQERTELIPIGEAEFKLPSFDAIIQFNRGDDNTIQGFTLIKNGEHKAEKIE